MVDDKSTFFSWEQNVLILAKQILQLATQAGEPLFTQIRDLQKCIETVVVYDRISVDVVFKTLVRYLCKLFLEPTTTQKDDNNNNNNNNNQFKIIFLLADMDARLHLVTTPILLLYSLVVKMIHILRE